MRFQGYDLGPEEFWQIVRTRWVKSFNFCARILDEEGKALTKKHRLNLRYNASKVLQISTRFLAGGVRTAFRSMVVATPAEDDTRDGAADFVCGGHLMCSIQHSVKVVARVLFIETVVA